MKAASQFPRGAPLAVEVLNMPAPTITGTVSNQATTSETPIDPFSGVTIGDTNAGATDTLSITLSGPGSLSGTGLSLSSGIYKLTGTAAAITSELRALSFTPVDGVPNTSATTTFALSDTSSAYGVDTYDPPLTLANFTGTNGANPLSNVVSDAAGDLFGVTSVGGAGNDGTVFEIAKSTGALTTLASFTGANGDEPWGVTVDAAGDLFGTTAFGGADDDGTVFEIAASTGKLTTLATFTGANGELPFGTVISDAAGDLFGTTAHGAADGYGTVFEIAASTGELTTLVTFTGDNGATPTGSLTTDAEGDLFGTTANGGIGGANGDGTVFEIAKSTGKLTTLASFTGSNGEQPERGVTIDAAGDLFGTTYYGGADDDGIVFEVVKSTGALITLATFTGANGANPLSDLVIDAAGDLFGTTELGGADNGGTAFEIAKSTGLLSTIATFTGANGNELDGGLIINSAGDLIGTAYYGGANEYDGTVFELPASFVATPTVDDTTTVAATDSDPGVAPTITGTVSSQATTSETPIDPFSGVTIGDTNAGATDTLSITLSGLGSLSGTGLSLSSGIYKLTGTAAAITSELRALSFTPVDGVPNTSATTTFTLSDTSSAVSHPVVATTTVTDSDPGVTTGVTPEVTGGASISTVAGAAAVALDPGLSISDLDSSTLAGATISISAGLLSGDTMTVGSPQAGVTSNYNASTGLLTLSGQASLSTYQTELDSVMFASATSLNPSSRAITWSVTDGVDPPAQATSKVAVFVNNPDLDISLQSTSGQLALWQASGSTTPTLSAAALLGADPGSSWLQVWTGSFFSGGASDASDILLQNTNGSVAVWQMQGATLLSGDVVANPGPSWHVDGVGDFNGDGKTDIALQNDNGSVAVWEMSGGQISQSAVVANPGPSWHVEGTGDFNGDGKSDIVLQNTNGSVAIWNMNGDQISQSTEVANPGPSWHVVETGGDLYGDGKSDIVLQNTNGSVAVWEINGDQISQSGVIANPGASWHVVGTGDFNSDGKTDLVLQNNSGAVAVWDMNGSTVSQSGGLANPGPTWSVVGGHIG
jgi:uncharacterized repeat protein (TIGR03803 family)